MERDCDHDWVFRPSGCCNTALYCSKCPRATKASSIGPGVRKGDHVVINEDGIARKKEV